MTKLIFSCVSLLICGLAANTISRDTVNQPSSRLPEVTVITNYYNTNLDGSYEYKYVLSNGVQVLQKGIPKIVNGQKVIVVTGYESYYLPEDGLYRTREYVADENGYRVTLYNVSSTAPDYNN